MLQPHSKSFYVKNFLLYQSNKRNGWVFFGGASEKRNYVLIRGIKAQLSCMCETCWIERHDSLMQIMVELPKIVEALEFISGWDECTTAAKAKSLLTAVTSSDLIVTTYTLSKISGLLLPLSRSVSTPNRRSC